MLRSGVCLWRRSVKEKGDPYPAERKLGEDVNVNVSVKLLLRSARLACLGAAGEGVEGDRDHLMAGRGQKVKVKVKGTVAPAENQPADGIVD